MPFTCNICGEESTRICGRCTKDTCNNHLCEKCLLCSDCCDCEVALDDHARPVVRPALEIPPEPEVEPEPELEPGPETAPAMDSPVETEGAEEAPVGGADAEPDAGPLS